MDYVIHDDNLNIDILIETNPMHHSDNIVAYLKGIRQAQHLTQQDIADATGMARANIARIESCKYTPTIDVLNKYANALGYELNLSLQKK